MPSMSFTNVEDMILQVVCKNSIRIIQSNVRENVMVSE